MKSHPLYTEDDWQVDYAAGMKLTCPDCGWRDPEQSLLSYYNVYSLQQSDRRVHSAIPAVQEVRVRTGG